MKYRFCSCGQAVEFRSTRCPLCQTDLTDESQGSGARARRPAPAGQDPQSAAAEDRQDWFYMYDGHMVGPCTTEVLQKSVASGTLPGDIEVWAAGMKEWKPVSEVLDIADLPAPPPFPTAPDPAELAPGAAQAASPAATAVASEAPPAADPSPAEDVTPAPVYRTPVPGMPFADVHAASGPLLSGELHPWRRWFARIVDISVMGFSLGILVGIFAPASWFFESSFVSTIIVLALWMLVEPFVLVWFENTPGKALLNIRLRTVEGRSLKLDQAFQRSARVWFFGLGAGLPIISIFTMAASYVKLNREGIASWDKAGNVVVSHGSIGMHRWVGIGLFIGFYLLITFISALP